MGENLFLKSLLCVSEKSSKIAKMCRQNDRLLSLLVREKEDDEKNPRFLHDFKTLVDVLVQQVIRHDICRMFPDMIGSVYGEESNEFELDEGKIIIEIKPTLDETAKLLCQVLKDDDASEILASLAHEDVQFDFDCEHNLDDIIKPQNLSIWIDPIDSTGEYIQGKKGDESLPVKSGLPCVTVLIGVYDKNTGKPLIGVINQPFYIHQNGIWTSRTIYGYDLGDFKGISDDFSNIPDKKIVAVSTSEDPRVKNALTEHGYTIIELAGAGYKLLNIITGVVSAYVLTKPTTYFWDICAGNAILNGSGGGVLKCADFKPIEYKGWTSMKNCCNTEGIFAFRNEDVRDDIVKILNLHPK